MKTYEQNYVLTPGETIKGLLEERNISIQEFAKRIGLSVIRTNRLINGEVVITPLLANKIEAILGNTSSYWINLELRHRRGIKV